MKDSMYSNTVDISLYHVLRYRIIDMQQSAIRGT